MEDDWKRYQIPAFGNWDSCDEFPITQYFELASQAGPIRGHYFSEDVDLFNMPEPVKPVCYHHSHKHHQHHRKQTRKASQKKLQSDDLKKKQGKVSEVTAHTTSKRPRPPKGVDEDLYKIPPELLYQKPRRKRLVRSFLLGCLGMNCIS